MSVEADRGEDLARPGFPFAVVVVALAAGVGMIPVFDGINQPSLPSAAMVSAGWVALGLAAALLVDRPELRRVGAVFAASAVVPAVVGVVAVRQDADHPWRAFQSLWHDLGWAIVLLALAAMAWSVGWARDRMSRRRLVWLGTWAAGLFGVVLAARTVTDEQRAAVVTMLALWSFAAGATRALLLRDLRPVAEPLVDAALVLAALVFSGALGVGVLAAGRATGLPSPEASAVFVAVATVALLWPLGAWLRGDYLERRYGQGTLTPADVALITAGLHREADPRALLAKAAAMVAAASGHREVSIVLGPDTPDEPGGDGDPDGGLLHHALVVGGDRVGTLSIRPEHPEGPEPRQSQSVIRLLPTVSLVARAVELAIEAEHAREDVARERDLERSRILGDLHDGVGPVLAGLSMRVQAQLRREPTPLLEALAKELADCRGDLRRIVSGLTPSALHDGDLVGALTRLVDSFESDGRRVTLRTAMAPLATPAMTPEVTVAVYRCVAEGITNALRHGDPTVVTVDVRLAATGRIEVDVCDDGTGGAVVPGVGLTSLSRRAQQLGGSLQVGAAIPTGVRLHVELPAQGVAA